MVNVRSDSWQALCSACGRLRSSSRRSPASNVVLLCMMPFLNSSARGRQGVSRRSENCPTENFEDAVRELEGIAERRLSRMDIPGPFWEIEQDYILGRSGPEPGLLHEFLLAERGRTDQAQPAFFEVAFGQRGSRPGEVDPKLSTPAPVRIGEVNLRGRIDRVDLAATCFAVIDYKTGSAVPTLAEIRSGASLQLPLYLRAAEQLLDREGDAPAPAAGLYYRLRDPVELQLALGSGRYNGVAFTLPGHRAAF